VEIKKVFQAMAMKENLAIEDELLDKTSVLGCRQIRQA
jgi:hypothetical protein